MNIFKYDFCLNSRFKSVPYIGYYMFSTPAIMLRDSELIKNVLIRDFNYFEKVNMHMVEKYDPLLAINPFFNIGEKWKRGRNILVSIFSTAKVRWLGQSESEGKTDYLLYFLCLDFRSSLFILKWRVPVRN